MKRPLAAAGVSLLTLLVFLFLTDARYGIPVLAVCVVACLCTCKKKKEAAEEFFSAVSCVCAAAILLAGFTIECMFRPAQLLCGHSVHLEGTADRFCEPYTSETSPAVLKNCTVNGRQTTADVYVIFPSSFSCAYGDTVETDAYVFSGGAESLRENGFVLYPSAKALGTPETLPAKHRTPIYYAKLVQMRLAAALDRALPEESAAIVKALLLGDKASLSADFRTKLSLSGASHIFAVSGMHLSLWSGILFLILRKRSRTKLLPNVAAGAFVLFYMALTGFSPSVMRSGIMLLTVFAGYCFRRPADPVNSLGFSALLLLCADPLTALDVSFLLSFNATAAVFILYPYFERRAENRGQRRFSGRRALLSVRNSVLLSLCALLFTLPVSGEYFGSVSLLSPVSSLVCTLPAEGVMLCSALALAFSPLSFVSAALFRVCARLTQLIILTVNGLSSLSAAVFPMDMRLLFGWYILTAAIVFCVYRFGGKNVTKTLFALLLCAVNLIPAAMLRAAADADNVYLRITSDGNAGAVLLYTHDGGEAFVLYNPEDENSLPELVSYMNRRVIPDIDLLIIPTGHKKAQAPVGRLQEKLTVKATAGLGEETTFTCTLTDDVLYRNAGADRSGAGVLYCGKLKTVFRFYAGTTLPDDSEEFSNGDVLICRSRIPEDVVPENFSSIIVLSGRTADIPGLPVNAISTAGTNGVTVKYDSKEALYAIDR